MVCRTAILLQAFDFPVFTARSFRIGVVSHHVCAVLGGAPVRVLEERGRLHMESKTARVLRKGRALFGYFACLERPRVHCNKQPFIAKVFFFVFV